VPPEKFRVALIQMSCGPDPEQNLERALGRISDAAGRGAQVVCLPELFQTQYFCQREDHALFELAEPIPGPASDRLAAAARSNGVVLIASLFEKRAAGVYHNTAAIFDRDGSLRGLYRKMHIPDDPLYYEKFYFTPGDTSPATNGNGSVREVPGFKVWKTRYADIGVLICWDQWYPEAARIMALLGAEVLFYPTAIGWHPSEKKEWGTTQVESWRTMQRAHAIANGIYVASPNRIGHENEPGTDGIDFFGNSFIVDPSGRIIASANDEEKVLIAKCDPAEIESTRRNWPFLRDRRVDAYAPILQRYLAE